MLVAFTIVVLGGMGSIAGALIGGLFVGVVESLSSVFLGASLGQIGIFLLFIVVLLLRPSGLFLLAPAFYMAGYEEYTPQDVACPTAIVHGWHDVIVPVENSIRWAREHTAELHVLDSDHRLEDRIDAICVLLRAFLIALGPGRDQCRRGGPQLVAGQLRRPDLEPGRIVSGHLDRAGLLAVHRNSPLTRSCDL